MSNEKQAPEKKVVTRKSMYKARAPHPVPTVETTAKPADKPKGGQETKEEK